MSWQVRLGDLDEEIREFLDNNPNVPIKDEREFVKYAVRKAMMDLSIEEKKYKELESIIDKKIKEEIG